MAAEPWRLAVLGSVACLERGEETWIPERRTAALLALLALDGPLPRERAAGLLFPDRDAPRARANLRQLLFRLRQRADVLTSDPLALHESVRVDAEATTDAGDVPGEPLSVLGAYDYSDLAEVEERLVAIRERIRHGLRTSLVMRAKLQQDAGDPGGALDAVRKLLVLDPLDEDATRLAMRLQLELEDPAGALSLYSRARDALERSLGVGPSDATTELAKRAATMASSPLRGARESGIDRGIVSVSTGGPIARRAEAGGWIAEGAALLRMAALDLEPGPRRGQTLVQLAWLEHQLGRHEEAQVVANAGMSLLAPDDRSSARIEGLFVLGSLARVRGDRGEASRHWREALDLASHREGEPESLTLELNLGMVEDGLGRTEAALQHYLTALPLAEAAEDTYSTIVILNNIGHALLSQGRTAEARTLLLRSTSLAQGFGDRRLHAYALESLALCELRGGEARMARGLAARVLAEARAIGDPVLQIESAVTFAEAEETLGERASAVATARAALAIARTHQYVAGHLSSVARGVLVLARAKGESDPAARRAVAVLAYDSTVSADILEQAQNIASTWGLAAPEKRAAMVTENMGKDVTSLEGMTAVVEDLLGRNP